MSLSIQSTTITNRAVEVVISDSPDMAEATLWIQVKVTRPPDRDLPLAVLQGIALRDGRDEISAQIQAITQTHGPVP